MKLRRGSEDQDKANDGPADPYAELFSVPDKYKVKQERKEQDEGSVTNSLAMLTAIPEVDLGMEYVFTKAFLTHSNARTFIYSTRLKNIEETEKAKRTLTEERKDRKRKTDDEEHLAAARCQSCAFILSSNTDILQQFTDPTSR